MQKALIIYDSYSGNTEKMAKSLREGLASGSVEVDTTLKSIDNTTKEDLLDANIILFGAPTRMANLPSKTKEFLDGIDASVVKGKVGASFGSCGGTCESIPMITGKLKSLEMNVVEPGLKVQGRPRGIDLERCRDFGKGIVDKL